MFFKMMPPMPFMGRNHCYCNGGNNFLTRIMGMSLMMNMFSNWGNQNSTALPYPYNSYSDNPYMQKYYNPYASMGLNLNTYGNSNIYGNSNTLLSSVNNDQQAILNDLQGIKNLYGDKFTFAQIGSKYYAVSTDKKVQFEADSPSGLMPQLKEHCGTSKNTDNVENSDEVTQNEGVGGVDDAAANAANAADAADDDADAADAVNPNPSNATQSYTAVKHQLEEAGYSIKKLSEYDGSNKDEIKNDITVDQLLLKLGLIQNDVNRGYIKALNPNAIRDGKVVDASRLDLILRDDLYEHKTKRDINDQNSADFCYRVNKEKTEYTAKRNGVTFTATKFDDLKGVSYVDYYKASNDFTNVNRRRKKMSDGVTIIYDDCHKKDGTQIYITHVDGQRIESNTLDGLYNRYKNYQNRTNTPQRRSSTI